MADCQVVFGLGGQGFLRGRSRTDAFFPGRCAIGFAGVPGDPLPSPTPSLTDAVAGVLPEDGLGLHQLPSKMPHKGVGVPSGLDVGIAVDVGTTTVVVYLVDLSSGEVVDSGLEYSGQISYGVDAVSRLEYVERSGVESLNRSVVDTVNGLVSSMVGGRSHLRVGDVVVAGTTVMSYIFLDRDPMVVGVNPGLDEFRLPHVVDAEMLRLRCSGRVYAVPGVSGYVGGDVVGDILVSGLHGFEGSCMLVDVGSEGGLVLGGGGRLLAGNVLGGSVFEGVNVACGMGAVEGAIDDVKLVDGEEVFYSTVGDGRPAGLCGSGLISLLGGLFVSRVVDRAGRFSVDAGDRVRRGDHGMEYVVVFEDETFDGRDIVLTEGDVKRILSAKAAFFAGARLLASAGGVSLADLERVFVAGSFGYRFDVERAVSIGLLPDIPRDRFEFIGNGSARGAFMVLVDEAKKKEAEEIARRASYLDLSGLEGFEDECMAAAQLPHEDEALFPSVESGGA